MIGGIITMGGEGDIDSAINQRQTWPVELPQRIKMDYPSHGAVAGANYRWPRDIRVISAIINCVPNHHRPAELLGSAGHIQRVQPMNIMDRAGDDFLGLGLHKYRPRARVDHRRARDADLGYDVA